MEAPLIVALDRRNSNISIKLGLDAVNTLVITKNSQYLHIAGTAIGSKIIRDREEQQSHDNGTSIKIVLCSHEQNADYSGTSKCIVIDTCLRTDEEMYDRAVKEKPLKLKVKTFW